MDAALRAYFGYLFLVFTVRVVGRRPGRQLTPFEFVLVFYIGGLALTAIAANQRSFVTAVCQVLAIGLAHTTVTLLRTKFSRLALLFDGTPLILLSRGKWREATLRKMRVEDDDVMFAARDRGLKSLDEIELAVLERNGEITVIPKRS